MFNLCHPWGKELKYKTTVSVIFLQKNTVIGKEVHNWNFEMINKTY